MKIQRPTIAVLFMLSCIYLTGISYCSSLFLTKYLIREGIFLISSFIMLVAYAFVIFKDHGLLSRIQNPICYSIMGFQFVLILSTFFSMDVSNSFYGSYYRHMGLVVLTAILFLPFIIAVPGFRKSDISLLIIGIIIFLSINAIYGITQAMGLDLKQLRIVESKGLFSIRPTGFMSNPDFFSTLTLLGIFPALSLSINYLQARKYFTALLLLIAFSVQITALVMSLTRGCWIAFLCGIPVYCILSYIYCIKGLNIVKSKLVIFVILIVFVIASTILFSVIFTPKFANLSVQKMQTIISMEQEYVYTGKVIPLDRPYIWRDTLTFAYRSFNKGLIFGVGPENFGKYFMPFKSLELSQIAINKFFDTPHNYYLSLLACTGIFGLLAYLMIIYYVIKTSFRSLGSINDKQIRLIISALLAAVAAYCVNMIFSFEILETGMLFYIFIGVLIYYSKLGQNDEKVEIPVCNPANELSAQADPSPQTVNLFRKLTMTCYFWSKGNIKYLSLMHLAAALLIVSLGIISNGRQIYADHIYKRSCDELKKQDADLDAAIILLEKVCDICPRETFYTDELLKAYGQKAGILLNSQKTKEAEQQYQKSISFLGKYIDRTSNPTVTYMTAALNSYRIGFLDDSIASLSAALVWDRWNTHIHNMLSGFYIFKYSLANDDSDILSAFQHLYTITRILKYFPHRDANAFKNTIAYANMIYEKNGDKNIFVPIQDVFLGYAQFARKSNETEKEFLDAMKNSEGTESQQNIKASHIFYKYRVGDIAQEKALSELKGIKISDDRYIKEFISEVERGK